MGLASEIGRHYWSTGADFQPLVTINLLYYCTEIISLYFAIEIWAYIHGNTVNKEKTEFVEV